jgi:hypothetical protein
VLATVLASRRDPAAADFAEHAEFNGLDARPRRASPLQRLNDFDGCFD